MVINFVASGPIEWGSARMRAWWVAPYLPGAVCTREPLPDADVYIWQKWADIEFVKGRPDARHFWDICDPVYWWDVDYSHEVGGLARRVVASNRALAEDAGLFFGREVAMVPDVMEPAHFTQRRAHVQQEHVRFIWYGVALNRVALYGALANLERLVSNGHSIGLTIFDDRPDIQWQASDRLQVYHARWSLAQEVSTLAAHDIALLPPYPGPWGRVKSRNRAHTAALCGLPPTDGMDYDRLARLVTDAEHRQEVADANVPILSPAGAAEWWQAIIEGR